MIWHLCPCGRPYGQIEGDLASSDRCPVCRLKEMHVTDGVPSAPGEIAPKRDPRVARPRTLGGPFGNEAPKRTWMGYLWPCIVLAVVAVIGYWLTVRVTKVRDAAARMTEHGKHKCMAVTLHNFHDSHGCLPASAAFLTKDGQPGLSWRVALLPYIEGDALHKQFALDEPWDSPTNLPLLAQMPKTYLQPGQVDDGTGMTHYQVFVGPGTAFEDISRQGRPRPLDLPAGMRQGLRLQDDFPDGTSNTILVATAKKAVPWTKPDDLPFAPNAPLAPLNERFKSGVTVSMADGSVRSVRREAEAAIRAAITRNGGERVEEP